MHRFLSALVNTAPHKPEEKKIDVQIIVLPQMYVIQSLERVNGSYVFH